MLSSDFQDTVAAAVEANTRRVRTASLSFYKTYSLIGVADLGLPEPNEYYFLWATGKPAVPLNWTNEPIYETNEADGMRLVRSTLREYVLFLFHFVRGQLGRFLFIDSADDIRWLPELGAKEKGIAMTEKAGVTIAPIRYIGVSEAHDLHILRAEVIFKNALFRTDILVAPYPTRLMDAGSGELEEFTLGQMKMVDEDLLVEDLPVIIDHPPGIFG